VKTHYNTMKVIICGGRNINEYDIDKVVNNSGFKITTLICGMAKGVDSLGYMWAMKNNIHIIKYYPDWNKYGAGAGPIRNKEMVNNADGVIAIWDEISRGTKSTITLAKKKGIPVYIERI